MTKGLARPFYVFMCCLLTVPLCVYFLDGVNAESAGEALIAGVVLGIAHVLIRPVLRFVSAPLGCMTMGLSGVVIDVALIYGCDYLLPGFEVTGVLYALIMAIAINIACLLIAGRR